MQTGAKIYTGLCVGSFSQEQCALGLAMSYLSRHLSKTMHLFQRELGETSGETTTQGTVEYLRKFPVYNPDANDMSERGKWRDHEYEAFFGTLAQWLFDDGAARSLRKGVRKEDEDCPENSTLREIVHIVSAYEHLSNKI